jgi:hypothetical protein
MSVRRSTGPAPVQQGRRTSNGRDLPRQVELAPNRPQFKIGFTIAPGAALLPSLPPQGELVATPAFSGVDQPVVVRGSGFAPDKIVALNWTTVTGNRISGGSVPCSRG